MAVELSTEDREAGPRLHLSGRVDLPAADEVLAVGATSVRGAGSVANLLYAIESVLREGLPRMLTAIRQVVDGDDGRLVCAIHPAGGPVEISVRADGQVALDAWTGLTGPGYHRFLVGLAVGLGQALGLQWEVDEPGPELEERFLSWLRLRARAALTSSLASGDAGVRWLPELLSGTGCFCGEGAVATVCGPRSEAWLQAVVVDPTAGIDAFPWWEPGRGVAYLVGRARVLLWRDVRWRLPTTDDELATLSEASNLLAEAWQRAPGADGLPWGAWHEVLTLLGEAEERRRRVGARARTGPAVGYRRHLVREPLPGGWSVELPGRMGVSWSEEEGWCAWDEGRTVWFTVLEGSEGAPPPPEGDVVARLERPDGAAAIVRTKDDEGEPLDLLSGHVRQGQRLGVITLAWQGDPGGRAWAEACWRSLRADESAATKDAGA